MISLAFTNVNKKIKLTANPIDQAGRPSTLDPNNPLAGVVDSGSDGSAKIESVAGDPNSAYVFSGAAFGPFDFTITGDADTTAGVVPISESGHAEVGSNQATSLGLTIGAEEDA